MGSNCPYCGGPLRKEYASEVYRCGSCQGRYVLMTMGPSEENKATPTVEDSSMVATADEIEILLGIAHEGGLSEEGVATILAHIQAQATALAERDARVKELETDRDYWRRSADEYESERRTAESERDELKATLARVLEWARGRCECCGYKERSPGKGCHRYDSPNRDGLCKNQNHARSEGAKVVG